MSLLNQARAKRVMADAGVDVLIATSPSNVAYMSDYQCVSHRLNPGLQVYGLLPADDHVPLGLVMPSLEVDAWAEQPGAIQSVSLYGTFYRYRKQTGTLSEDDRRIYENAVAKKTKADGLQALVASLTERGLTNATIGMDDSDLLGGTLNAIAEALPCAHIVPAASMFRQIRLVKTEEEVRRLERSAQITEQAINYVFEHVREGISERELANLFKARASELGGDPGFWVVSAGRRTGHTHARQSDYRVRMGDMIKLDVGCKYEFYWSDVGRTKTLGEPDTRALRFYEILCAGLRAAIEQARPGIRASQLFETAVNTIRELGIPEYRRHHCGHGIGIDVYDDPLIQARGHRDIYGMGDLDPVLEPGMVINLETPYYIIGEYGFIAEDTLVVREKETQLLTSMDHAFVTPGGSSR